MYPAPGYATSPRSGNGRFRTLVLLARVTGILIAAASCSKSGQAAAEPITISSQDALDAALAKAHGGETIKLAPGDYAVVIANRQFTATVTVTAADPAKRPNIVWHRLTGVSNFTFANVEMARDAKPSNNPDAENIGKVIDGNGITFDDVYVHGSLDGNPSNDMAGPLFGGVQNLKVINCEFQQLGRGAMFGSIDKLLVANNKVHEMRSDGFDFQTINNAVIENNSFTSFARIQSDHPDAIQFWTARTTRQSTDIIVRNNQIYQGNGSGMQGIFFRDELETLPFERVTIENNIVIGSNMANGITVGHGKDIKILNNTVLSPPDDDNPVWIRMDDVENLTMTGNIVEMFRGAQGDMSRNKSPERAGINMKLLKKKNLANVRPKDVIVPGWGYQPPAP